MRRNLKEFEKGLQNWVKSVKEEVKKYPNGPERVKTHSTESTDPKFKSIKKQKN